MYGYEQQINSVSDADIICHKNGLSVHGKDATTIVKTAYIINYFRCIAVVF
jgi:hypothetical protein